MAIVPGSVLPSGVPGSMVKLPTPVRAAASKRCAHTVLALGALPTTKKLLALMKSVNVPRPVPAWNSALLTTRKFSSLVSVKPHPTVAPGVPTTLPDGGLSSNVVVACAMPAASNAARKLRRGMSLRIGTSREGQRNWLFRVLVPAAAAPLAL